MCNQTCFSVDTFTFLYDDDDDDGDDNDDEHYPILTHKNPYMGKSAYGNLGQRHEDEGDDDEEEDGCSLDGEQVVPLWEADHTGSWQRAG